MAAADPTSARSSADDGFERKGDNLKYYCVVFGILCAVIVGVAIHQSGELDEYRAANAATDRLLTGEGLAERSSSGQPGRIRDLAIEIEKMVNWYKQSVGDDADSGASISEARMRDAALRAQVKQAYASTDRDDPNRAKGYRTRSREFHYDPTTLDRLNELVMVIELMGRYRVYEMRWKLEEGKENSEPPFNRINKPVIRVGFRQPLSAGQ